MRIFGYKIQMTCSSENRLLYRLEAKKIFSCVYIIYAKVAKLFTFLPALCNSDFSKTSKKLSGFPFHMG